MIDRLAEHFDITSNQADEVWTKAELTEALRDKVGAFTTSSERIDADVLAACPQPSWPTWQLVTTISIWRP